MTILEKALITRFYSVRCHPSPTGDARGRRSCVAADRALRPPSVLSGPSASTSLLFPAVFDNSLTFHQHLGEKGLTRLFSSTSWRDGKRSFFLYVFSMTYGICASIFTPFFFVTLGIEESAKSFNFNDIDFRKVFVIHR
jgi:hypothetical protein